MNATSKPLYHSVAEVLREEIVSGVYPIGSYLATEDKLRERFGVSRHTVREALRMLRENGLVSSRRGSGTRVLPPVTGGHDFHQVMSINDLLVFAEDTTFRIETLALEDITRESSDMLGLRAGESWLHAGGIRYKKGEPQPLCWSSYFIPREFAHLGRLLQRYTGPIFTLLEDFSGHKVIEVQQQISATIVPDSLAESLKTPPGSAALRLRRTYRSDDGKILQVTLNTHPAERFQHVMTMRRLTP